MHMVLVCRSAHYTKATFLSILTGAPSQCVSCALQAHTPGGPARSLKATHYQIPPACMRLLTVEGGRVALTRGPRELRAWILASMCSTSHPYTLL